MAILSMIEEGDPDLTTYLTDLLKSNEVDQPKNTIWFPTPKNPSKTADHNQIHTRIPKEMRQLQQKEKLDPKDDVESRLDF